MEFITRDPIESDPNRRYHADNPSLVPLDMILICCGKYDPNIPKVSSIERTVLNMSLFPLQLTFSPSKLKILLKKSSMLLRSAKKEKVSKTKNSQIANLQYRMSLHHNPCTKQLYLRS
jgi:hypothetical protein